MTSVLLVALGLFQPNPLLHSSSTKAAAPVQPATAQAPIAGSGSAAPTTVDVKSLPPVTVNPARKDWADWGYWAFGGLLVIVGIFQVALLYRTVTIGQKQRDLLDQQTKLVERQANLMERQANLMERQATSLEESIQVAEKNAAAASESSKAAIATVKQMRGSARTELRARVSVVSAKRLGVAGAGSYQAEITIKNFGKVTAYRCTCLAALALRINNSSDEFPSPRIVGDEPNVALPPNGEFTMVRHLEPGTFQPHQHTDVMNGTQAVYFYGKITYRDGFQSGRYTEFRMKCCGPDYSLNRFAFSDKGNTAG
jgi:hypothetical protein